MCQATDIDSVFEIYPIEFLEPEEIDFFKKVADFFENAKGIKYDC